jgi:flavin reductase (DIM6/NTAB) family NADH-FMN oxidoreductase RutF
MCGTIYEYMKKKKPWNRVSEQIYSLSTHDSSGKLNMNIATYVVPVTMDIKRYVIAVYKNTQTHKNIFENRDTSTFVLQALSKTQKSLVQVLGKKSGQIYDKQSYLKKRRLLENYSYENADYAYLIESSFSLLMVIETYTELGDHDLIVARVVKTIQNNFDAPLLDTSQLDS